MPSRRTYRFLTLTDHRTHSQENSLYPLIAMLSTHPACAEVRVASRGLTQNDPFFSGQAGAPVWAAPADSGFQFDPTGAFFERGKPSMLLDFDVVLLRLARPLSDPFLHFLSDSFPETLFINDPVGISRTGNKSFLLEFPELCPPMRLCHTPEEVMDFASAHPIVMKPLKEYGGKGIFRISGNEVQTGSETLPAVEFLEGMRKTLEEDGYLAMKYLKNVNRGDKRILVVNGKIMASALRLPAKNSWLCNVAQGGYAVPAVANANERKIIQRLIPVLREQGVVVFGADTLSNDRGKRVLSEINTLSIGGFPQAQEQTGRPVLKQTIRLLIQYIDERFSQRRP